MDFKFPNERLPFSVNPNPSSKPIQLIERETADIPTNMNEEYTAKLRRNVTREVLDNFYLDLGCAHYSAIMQCCPTHHLHGAYERGARQSRGLIEESREMEARQLRRRVA